MRRLFSGERSGRSGRCAALARPGSPRCVVGAVAVLAGFAVLVSACGVESAANNAVEAPLGVLKASDSVVETNLQLAETATDGMGSSVATTTGPSTSYRVISVSSGAGRPTVLVGFNQLSNDCLGLIEVGSPGQPVLGATQAGTYYFWLTSTAPADCSAARFAATPSVPTGWPAGDPTSSGWPVG